MPKRNLSLKQDPSDRNKILDSNGNLVFICVSGFPSDVDDLIEIYDRFQSIDVSVLEDAEEKVKDALEAVKNLIEKVS